MQVVEDGWIRNVRLDERERVMMPVGMEVWFEEHLVIVMITS